MSRNAIENGQCLALAFLISVDRTKAASMVLRPFLKPNCSPPSILCSSAMLVMMLVILTVRSLKMLEGTVMGRYWPMDKESPP